jgi:hypothetical protein
VAGGVAVAIVAALVAIAITGCWVGAAAVTPVVGAGWLANTAAGTMPDGLAELRSRSAACAA